MNSKKCKTSDPPRLLLNLTGKINLKRSGKYVALLNLNLWKNIKKSYKNNKFKISSPKWNEKKCMEKRLKKHGQNINL